MDELDQVIADARKVLNVIPDHGVLGIQSGASAGQIYVPYKSGYVWICEYQAGSFTAAKAVKRHPNANLRMKPGIGVLLGYDEKGERCVLGEDFDAVRSSGENPAGSNPLDPTRQYVGQQGIVTGVCTPDNPDTTLYCVVTGWIFIRNHTIYRWGNDTKVNLTSFVPGSTGQHCVVGVFVLSDGSATEVKASTAKSQASPLTLTDAQECVSSASAGSTAMHFWRLYYGQTAVKASDTYLDGRGIINVGMGDIIRSPRIVTAAGAVTVTATDDVVSINKTIGASTTVNLPASPITGVQYTVKDKKGDAGSNNITITPASGTIDGSGTYVISTNYGKATVMYDGTEWSVIGT